jgi:hypothetical protein
MSSTRSSSLPTASKHLPSACSPLRRPPLAPERGVSLRVRYSKGDDRLRARVGRADPRVLSPNLPADGGRVACGGDPQAAGAGAGQAAVCVDAHARLRTAHPRAHRSRRQPTPRARTGGDCPTTAPARRRAGRTQRLPPVPLGHTGHPPAARPLPAPATRPTHGRLPRAHPQTAPRTGKTNHRAGDAPAHPRRNRSQDSGDPAGAESEPARCAYRADPTGAGRAGQRGAGADDGRDRECVRPLDCGA